MKNYLTHNVQVQMWFLLLVMFIFALDLIEAVGRDGWQAVIAIAAGVVGYTIGYPITRWALRTRAKRAR